VAPIFLTINASPWIPTAAKVRLLEWKIRMDLAQYAARAVPPVSIDSIAAYRPKNGGGEPIEVVSHLHNFDDDGHAIKLGRAALICRQASEPYEDKDWMRLKGRENWDKVFHMIVDSVGGPGQHWVRTTGLEEAWKVLPFRTAHPLACRSHADPACRISRMLPPRNTPTPLKFEVNKRSGSGDSPVSSTRSATQRPMYNTSQIHQMSRHAFVPWSILCKLSCVGTVPLNGNE
jgi:hypothetical protein